MTKLYAKEIEFFPSTINKGNGFNASNVEDALNQLYEVSTINVIESDFNYYNSGKIMKSSVLKIFSKGKYYVNVSEIFVSPVQLNQGTSSISSGENMINFETLNGEC